ncbi:MAG TPA: hypothetical protein VME70_13740 [Mycobacteriales bacterium]|nr:hypothetical protein [Mycobacteriales bacterium]
MIVRRAVVATVFVVSAATLSACGFEAPAIETTEKPSIQAVDVKVAAVDVDDTAITTTTVNGVPHYWLQATFVNNGRTSDTLTRVTTTSGTMTINPAATAGSTGASQPPAAGVVLPPGIPVEIGSPVPGATGPSVSAALSPPPQVGDYVTVVLTFAQAGTSARIQVPLIPAGETTNPTQPLPTGTASVPPAIS